MKTPKLISFLKRHKLTPGNVLLVCLAFWLTVLAVRVAIFWSISNGIVPAIFVRGLHIHHFITGFLLLCASTVLISKHVLSKYIPLIIFGIGLGLMFDEFIFWTTGHFNYWSVINFIAVAVTGSAMLIYYEYSKRYNLKHNPHPPTPLVLPRLLFALVPIVFIILILTAIFSQYHITSEQIRMINNVSAQQDPPQE